MLTVKRKNKAVKWLSYSSFYSMYSKCKETNTWWAAGKKSVRMLIIIKNLRLPVVVYSFKVRLLGNLNDQSINPGADLGGGCRGCASPPLPEMPCGFLIQLVFCKKTMWFIGVEVEKETSAPPPKDNPGSAPAINQSINQSFNQNQSTKVTQ